MEVNNNLNLGNDISVATLKIAQDQLKAKGDAAVQLIESATVTTNNIATPTTTNSSIDIKV